MGQPESVLGNDFFVQTPGAGSAVEEIQAAIAEHKVPEAPKPPITPEKDPYSQLEGEVGAPAALEALESEEAADAILEMVSGEGESGPKSEEEIGNDSEALTDIVRGIKGGLDVWKSGAITGILVKEFGNSRRKHIDIIRWADDGKDLTPVKLKSTFESLKKEDSAYQDIPLQELIEVALRYRELKKVFIHKETPEYQLKGFQANLKRVLAKSTQNGKGLSPELMLVIYAAMIFAPDAYMLYTHSAARRKL